MQQVSFMNMCMVQDGQGRVLVLDKVGDSYSGITFPGGHVEEGEAFSEAMVREMKEETGLTISSPLLCGVYHWEEDGICQVVFLYKTDRYEGELQSSEEGNVFWIAEEDFLNQNLAVGMERVWKIMHSDQISECHMVEEGNTYKAYLY